jgi:uncharacterized membrane protein YedE/YeeE
MTPDWNAFEPWSSLAGGMLIGLSASMLILGIGRVAGISGIVGGLLSPTRGDFRWRVLFVVGLLASALLWRAFGSVLDIRIEAGMPLILTAGLLVGYGSRLGSGCTSGHGVCGIARLSPRSAFATAVFMTAGFVGAGAIRPMLAGHLG